MQRIRFFDIAKGIAILAVILGHSAIETNLFAPHRTAQVVLSICFHSICRFSSSCPGISCIQTDDSVG